jgi:exopolyphosphatase/guanosine-5'-triphosphate,3'-diphosphate pyrophosphatase
MRSRPIKRMKAAVIDLGFNSLKMVSYEISPLGTMRAFDQESIYARLGEGLDRTGVLGPEPVARTIEALAYFKALLGIRPVDRVLAVATSPLREADNGGEFLQEVKDRTGLKFRTLTGNEEAVYSYLGALLGTGARDMLFFDLGGGSLEVLRAQNLHIRKVYSLPLGCLRLTERFAGRGGAFDRKEYSRLKKEVESLLPSKKALKLGKSTVLVGVGGTVRALAKIEQVSGRYPINKLHNFVVRRATVARLSRKLSKMDPREIRKLPSVGNERARTLAAGACVVDSLLEKWDFPRMQVSNTGLRDGVVYATLVDNPTRPKESRQSLLSNANGLTLGKGFMKRGGVFVKFLLDSGLMTPAEARILAFCGRYIREGSSTVPPEALFALIVSDDLPFLHRDQLFLASALVRSRSVRVADWHVEKVKKLLGRRPKERIRKLQAAIGVLEIIEKDNLEFRGATWKGARATLAVSGQAKTSRELLRKTLFEFGHAFSVEVVLSGDENPSQEEFIHAK